MKRKSNFIYTYIFPSAFYNYGYLEVSEFSLSKKGMIAALEKGFAPAVVIYSDFDEFLSLTRDF